MYLAMCADTGILIAALIWLLLLVALIGTPIVLAVVVFLRWVNARRERTAAES